jgi:transposase
MRMAMHRLQELVRLHRMGTGAREAARLLGMSPNTERAYREALEGTGLLVGDPGQLPELGELRALVEEQKPGVALPQHTSSVAEWLDDVQGLVEKGAGAKAIYDWLKLNRADFKGSEWAVKRLVKRIKRTRGVLADDVAVNVADTKPGEFAQVDFGYVGHFFDPQQRCMRKAYVFVMVLSHSRRMVTRLVFDQKVATWLRMHIEAFFELGGVPHIVVPDNLKSAVIRAAFAVDDETTLNKSYRELARHYGFKVDPTPPRSPTDKARVEAGVKYVKGNFFKTCLDEDAAVVRPKLQRWVDDIANVRTHGTTNRKPIDVFNEDERTALLPLPREQYELVVWGRAHVHRDCHVVVDRAMYSVPWRLVGEDVDVRGTPSSIALYFDDQRVATHSRVPAGKRDTQDDHLPPERRNHRQRNRAYWEERALAIGQDVATWVAEAFDSDDVLYKLRVVQNTVLMLEDHPAERANNACRRASHFGNYTYGGVKDVLKKALDLKPLPVVVDEDGKPLKKPRFARDIAELYQRELPLSEIN